MSKKSRIKRETELKMFHYLQSNLKTTNSFRDEWHPQIARLYQVFNDPNHTILVQEYAGHCNLHNYILRNGPQTNHYAR